VIKRKDPDQEIVDVLAAVAARLLPSDEFGAGAKEARVDRFFAKALQDDFLVDVGPFLRDAARELRTSGFMSAGNEKRDQIVAKLAANELRIAGVDGPVFVRVMTVLTLEGFLADPKHGGNDGAIGWRALGFDPERRS
jgi:gluconate 2-dehydrogenase gamma chain